MPTTAKRVDFATAASRLSTTTRLGPQERRRFRRNPIVVSGRVLSASGREFDCRTADISPGDVRIATPTPPEVGEHVVIYLEGYGRLPGRVARRCGETEVAIIFEFSLYKREKLAEQLTIAINGGLGAEDRPRIAAAREARHTIRIEHEVGDAYEGEVVDFSLAGVTIHSRRPPPPLGVWVRIGGVFGRVARYVEGGFAVDFERRTPPVPLD